MMDLNEQQRFSVPTPSDPRRRPPMGGTDCAWELPQLEEDALSARTSMTLPPLLLVLLTLGSFWLSGNMGNRIDRGFELP